MYLLPISLSKVCLRVQNVVRSIEHSEPAEESLYSSQELARRLGADSDSLEPVGLGRILKSGKLCFSFGRRRTFDCSSFTFALLSESAWDDRCASTRLLRSGDRLCHELGRMRASFKRTSYSCCSFGVAATVSTFHTRVLFKSKYPNPMTTEPPVMARAQFAGPPAIIYVQLGWR